MYKVCCAILQIDSNQILDVYYEGPGDINVLVTDEVLFFISQLFAFQTRLNYNCFCRLFRIWRMEVDILSIS